MLAAAADAQAQQQPDAGEQTPSVPVATLAPPAAGTADAAATDIAAAADAAIEAAGARNGQVPGANSGADVDAETGPENGTTNTADIGATEAAGAGADAAEAGAGDESRKKTGEPSAANGSGAVDTDKTPRAKPSARVDKNAAAGAETAVRTTGPARTPRPPRAPAPMQPARASMPAPIPRTWRARNADAKTRRAASRLTRRRSSGATTDGGKPPVDAAQLAALHPGDRFAHAASAAAQGSAQAGTQPRAGSSAVPVAGLAVEIAARAQAGSNRFEIRLDPPELGRIDVRLDIDRDGHVTSRLVVERSETLDLLRRDAPQLERALAAGRAQDRRQWAEFSLRDQHGRGSDRARIGARMPRSSSFQTPR